MPNGWFLRHCKGFTKVKVIQAVIDVQLEHKDRKFRQYLFGRFIYLSMLERKKEAFVEWCISHRLRNKTVCISINHLRHGK